jgi:hypothetical protein
MLLKIMTSDENTTDILEIFVQKAREDQARKYPELYLLGYNAMHSVVSQPTFRRNISPSSSGLKSMPSYVCYLLIWLTL